MSSPRIDDVMTWTGHPEDLIYLTSRLFPVNMRLFGSAVYYHRIILQICEEMRQLALTNLAGYGLPFGISGANVGVPFNIIGVVRQRGTQQASCRIMINPAIIGWSRRKHISQSNCGSIRLPESIPVRRFDSVSVRWFDESGLKHVEMFTQALGGDTIQHEVDHNQGILITDRQATGEL